MLSANRVATSALIDKYQNELTSLTALETAAKKSRKWYNSSLWSRTCSHTREVYISIRILSADTELATYFLCQHVWRRKGHVEDDPEYNLLEIENDCRERLLDPHAAHVRSHPDTSSHFDAARWISESQLFYWLISLNGKGVAPPAREMLNKFVPLWPQESRGLLFDVYVTELQQDHNKRALWLRQFRNRWLSKYMRLPARPPLDDADIARKVVQQMFSSELNVVWVVFHFWGQKLGLDFRALTPIKSSWPHFLGP